MISYPLLVFILYVTFGAVELFHPAEEGHTWKGRLRNIGFALILLIGGGTLSTLLFSVLPFEPRSVATTSPILITLHILAYMFILDFIFYWYHRAQHSFEALWYVHELHHAEVELNATTSFRTYWLERPIQTIIMVFPAMYLVGVDPIALAILPICTTGILFFTHANLKLNMGILTPVICGPQLHRIHHSDQPEHRNKNLSQFFPIIDVIFGTYYHPAADEYPTTGTQSLAHDASLDHVIKRPFKQWWRMVTKKRK